MATANWPSALQEKLNSDSFSYSFGKTVERTSMDVGLAKTRRTSTRPIDKVSSTINLDYSEFSAFQTFYKTTINGGADRFNYTHPLTGVSAEFRFVSEPSIRALGGRSFMVSMEWEIL